MSSLDIYELKDILNHNIKILKQITTKLDSKLHKTHIDKFSKVESKLLEYDSNITNIIESYEKLPVDLQEKTKEYTRIDTKLIRFIDLVKYVTGRETTSITELQEKIDELKTIFSTLKPVDKSKRGFPLHPSKIMNLFKKALPIVKKGITIRDIEHDILEFKIKDSIPQYVSSRFSNITEKNIKTKLNVPNFVNHVTNTENKQIETLSDTTFICLVPRGFPIAPEQELFVLIESIIKHIQNNTYRFREHDKDTLEEIPENKVRPPLQFPGMDSTGLLQKAIVYLSVEYMDVLYKYVLKNNKSLKDYTFVLPTSISNINMFKNMLLNLSLLLETDYYKSLKEKQKNDVKMELIRHPKIYKNKIYYNSGYMKELTKAYMTENSLQKIPPVLNILNNVKTPVFSMFSNNPLDILKYSQIYLNVVGHSEHLESTYGLQNSLIEKTDEYPSMLIKDFYLSKKKEFTEN
jgi:hypothetical protein